MYYGEEIINTDFRETDCNPSISITLLLVQ